MRLLIILCNTEECPVIMETLYNALYKFQHYLLGTAVFLLLLSASVRFDASSFGLLWSAYPQIAVLILLTGLALVILYIQLDKKKLEKLNRQINERHGESDTGFSVLLRQLTNRERAVFNLIIQGKSNKQIMSELYIEASTLKSHVNHIYKKLNIKDRKELRALSRDKYQKEG